MKALKGTVTGPQQPSHGQAVASGMHAKGMNKTCSHNSPGNGTGLDVSRIPKVNATDFWKKETR